MNDDEKTFSLGAFECFATCILNALLCFKKDVNYFLINYWNIEYFHKLLLGSRNISLCSLPVIFNIEILKKNETIMNIKEYLGKNNKIVVQCMASKLFYFPEKYLTGEGLGMEHTFLIENIENDGYKITDGVAGYKGILPFDEFVKLPDKNGNLIFYTIREIENKVNLTKDQIIKKIIITNNNLYNQNKFDFGQKAYELFKNELLKSQNFSKKVRDSWIGLNKITITTICNTRKTIWNSYKILNIFSNEVVDVLEEKVNELIKNWKFVILYLEKIKVSPIENNFLKLCEKLDDVNHREKEILHIMKENIK
jgi:hypothetical protein